MKQDQPYIDIFGARWQRRDLVDRFNTAATRVGLVSGVTAAALALPLGFGPSSGMLALTVVLAALTEFEERRHELIHPHPSLRHYAIDPSGKAMKPENNLTLLRHTETLMEDAKRNALLSPMAPAVLYTLGAVAALSAMPLQTALACVVGLSPFVTSRIAYYASMARRCQKLLKEEFVFVSNPSLTRVAPKEEKDKIHLPELKPAVG